MRFQVSFERNKAISALISDRLSEHGIAFQFDYDGHVEIAEPVDKRCFERFKTSLCKYNIDIIENNREETVERIKHLINLRLKTVGPQKKLSVEISEKIGRKYTTLARVFVTSTGYSIESYFIALKIEHAKQLIYAGELTFKEIANILNYNSLGHFSKQFKKHTGLTLSFFKKIIEHKLQHQ